MLKAKRSIFVSIAAIMLMAASSLVIFAQDEEVDEKKAVLSTVGTSLTELWPDKSCASFVTRHSGYPLVSLACRVGYSKNDRAQFLDAIFKRGFILKKESYKLSPDYGFYLYKTEYPIQSGRYVFFKLFFRDAKYLWPKTPFIIGRLAIYVQDVYRLKDVIRWQTLGIPLSYGVITHRKQSKEIAEKVREYNQELWMSLSLEPYRTTPLVGKMLTLKDGLDDDKRKTYLDEAFDQLGQVIGVSNRMGSRFTANVYAMRKLLSDLQERGIKAYLDTRTNKKSVAYETAQVMSMQAYRRDYVLDSVSNHSAMQKQWASSLKSMRQDGKAILVVHGRNWKSFQFIKQKMAIPRYAAIKYVKITDIMGVSR